MTETVAAAGTLAWSGRRWTLLTLGVLIGQLALIFWLGDRNPVTPRPAGPAIALHLLQGVDSEWLSLRDPTLFALPHPAGFAGLAWLTAKPPPLPVYDWTEEPHWLVVKPDQLRPPAGPVVVAPEPAPTWETPPLPLPELRLLEVSPQSEPITRSSLRLESGQGEVTLRSAPDLPSWPPRPLGPTDVDLLTNSVVQAMVGPDGKALSVTLLQPGSGSKAADDFALAKVRELQFDPLANYNPESIDFPRLADLRWCRLVFEWHTSPAPMAPTSR